MVLAFTRHSAGPVSSPRCCWSASSTTASSPSSTRRPGCCRSGSSASSYSRCSCRSRRDLFPLSVVLVFGAAALVLPQVASIAIYQVRHPMLSPRDPRLWATTLPMPKPGHGTRPRHLRDHARRLRARRTCSKKYFHYDDSAVRARPARTRIRHLGGPGTEAPTPTASPTWRPPQHGLPDRVPRRARQDLRGRAAGEVGDAGQPRGPRRQCGRIRGRPPRHGRGHVLGQQPGHLADGAARQLMNLWLQKSLLRKMGGPVGFNRASSNERPDQHPLAVQRRSRTSRGRAGHDWSSSTPCSHTTPTCTTPVEPPSPSPGPPTSPSRQLRAASGTGDSFAVPGTGCSWTRSTRSSPGRRRRR